MKALSIVEVLYKGKNIESQKKIDGHKPNHPRVELICDCDPGGDYCSGLTIK